MSEAVVLIFHARKNCESTEEADAYYNRLRRLLNAEAGLCISANVNQFKPQEIIGDEPE